LTQIRVIEALAMADGSAGWCAMIGCDGGYVSAFLDQSVARAMYPDRLVATGAAATTTGEARERAVPVRQRLSSFRMGLAVYQRGPLDRCLRDILTMNQHVVGTMRTYEMAGRLLLGLEGLRLLF
jgi:hypothetical protein